jgi:hypothetical protein
MDITKELLSKIEAVKQQKIDFSSQKVISFSQFNIYNNCPHQYKLLYIDKLKKDTLPNIQMVFGTAIHNTIQNYLDILYNKSVTEADQINLKEYFKSQFKTIYSEYKKQFNTHISTAQEMQEFFDDGIKILDYIKKKRKEYFNPKNESLIGIEVPINISPDSKRKNIIWRCHLDIVIHDKSNNKLRIIDLKTSYMGWKDKDKKDFSKTSQLVIYKEYFAKQYGFPRDNIEIEYIILKRKIFENAQFPQKQIQLFSPASGKNTINKLSKLVNTFIEEIFDEDGKVIQKEHEKRPSASNCKYCPFYNQPELCNRKK